MTNAHDPLFRRDFLRTIGVATLPLLAQGCDPEATGEEFRMGPPHKNKHKSSQSFGIAVNVPIAKALLEQSLIIDNSQFCSLPAKYGYIAGVGRQVRITNLDNDASTLFTVAELRHEDDETGWVRMSLNGRKRCGAIDTFDAILSSQCTADLSDVSAQSQDEFVERIVDKGSRILVLGCHGGNIEYFTDMQAERVTQALSPYGASAWICKGWNEAIGAFKCWHIDSTDIDPASFPGLAQVTRRDYKHCVSFHGSDVNGVLIGGLAPYELKLLMAKEIRRVTRNKFEVTVATAEDSFNGDNPFNVVNRFTYGPGGVQLEQSLEARTDYWEAISDAVADVFTEFM